MQGNTTEIDERNLLRLDALLSHGYGLSPQLVMRSKGLSIEAKALYGYLSSFAGAGDTAFPSTSRILEELDISKNRFYKIRKELVSWGFISIETTATSAGLRTVYTLPQNPIAIKTEIDEIANRRNEIKSSLVANLHNEDMVSHKGDSESERLQQSAGNEPCRQSEAKAQNRGSNLKPCLQSEDEGCLQSGDKLYIDTSINPKVSIDRSATRPSDDEVPSNWKVVEGMTDTTLRDDGESDRDANGRDALDAVPDGTYDPLPTVADMVQGRQASESYKTKKLRTLPKEDWIRVIGTHEAIISLETWNQTQALLAVGARSFTRSEEIGLFSRKVYCGHCNKLMRTGRSKRKSGTYYNYVICVRRHPEINPCPVHAVSNALMEKTILDQLDILAAKYKDGSLFSEIMDEESTIGIEIKRLKAELAQHKKKLVEYETGLKCLYLDKASGSISNSDYQFLSRELSAGKELAERKVDLCTENYNKILRSQEILREKAGVLESYSRPKELTRSMVETFIDHIVICSSSDGTSKQEIKIYWNF